MIKDGPWVGDTSVSFLPQRCEINRKTTLGTSLPFGGNLPRRVIELLLGTVTAELSFQILAGAVRITASALTIYNVAISYLSGCRCLFVVTVVIASFSVGVTPFRICAATMSLSARKQQKQG